MLSATQGTCGKVNWVYVIKILRTESDGEYVSNDFLNFCKTHGIHKQFTMQYTPQQNDVAERKNITIIEMVFYMM